MATPALRANPRSRGSGGSGEPTLPVSGGESGRILPFSAARAQPGSRDGPAQRDAKDRARVAGIWLSARAPGINSERMDGKSQAGSAADADRQLAVFAPA